MSLSLREFRPRCDEVRHVVPNKIIAQGAIP